MIAFKIQKALNPKRNRRIGLQLFSVAPGCQFRPAKAQEQVATPRPQGGTASAGLRAGNPFDPDDTFCH
jgi:hypothetical protein